MVRYLVLLTITAVVVLSPLRSFALRCGSSLANVGDLKHEVLITCGEPYSKEVIGYIDQEKNGDRIRVMKIEEWIIEEGGYYYSLVFEGNHLVKIQDAGKKTERRISQAPLILRSPAPHVSAGGHFAARTVDFRSPRRERLIRCIALPASDRCAPRCDRRTTHELHHRDQRNRRHLFRAGGRIGPASA